MNRSAIASRRALRRALPVTAAALAALLSGCVQPTVFTGDPKIPAGAQGCAARCRQEGLAMSAFIVMGEYSTGCVCQAPGTGSASSGVTASVSAAAAGVAMQMQRQEEQKRQERINNR